MDKKKITIGIPTILRDDCLKRLINSIVSSPFSGSIIVADQNKRSKINWMPNSIKVLDLEFDTGVSKARNAILDQLETDFILLLDDDLIFNYRVLRALQKDFQNYPKFGWISPAIKDLKRNEIESSAGSWKIQNNKLLRKLLPADGGFHEVDQPGLPGLYRSEVWKEVRFPSKVKIGREHVIMAWRFHDTDWKAGVDTGVYLEHRGCLPEPDYNKLRRRHTKGKDAFQQETGLTDIIHEK